MDPGPLDDSVLYDQRCHRSTPVFQGQGHTALVCRRRDYSRHRSHFDMRILPHLQEAGLYGLSRVTHMRLDHNLITALVERWRPETHTFHMPQGECTITLQDVGVQLGLPIEGAPVIGDHNFDWPTLCMELLGVTPPDDKIKGVRLNMNWLTTNFDSLEEDASPLAVERYARAYMLQLLGGCLFSDKSSQLVHMMFLAMLRDFKEAGRYSWGSAALAWLYRQLCTASRKGMREISGCLVLLQVWAWDHFQPLSPLIGRRHRANHLSRNMLAGDVAGLPPGPLAVRWASTLIETKLTHTLQSVRMRIDALKADEITWQPYDPLILEGLPDICRAGKESWTCRTPLICFHIVEWHRVDRVKRQFGHSQSVPDPVDREEDRKLHKLDLRTLVASWSAQHEKYILLWNNRREEKLGFGEERGTMGYADPYMIWYRTITRRFISPIGPIYYDFVCDALVKLSTLSATTEQLEIIKRTLQVASEHHRLILFSNDPPSDDEESTDNDEDCGQLSQIDDPGTSRGARAHDRSSDAKCGRDR